MPISQVFLEGDDVWPDMADPEQVKTIYHVTDDDLIQFARLKKGMKSGRSSIAIRADFPNGEAVLIETSMLNFLAVADVLRAAEAKDAGADRAKPEQKDGETE